jgi:hypothetical protein
MRQESFKLQKRIVGTSQIIVTLLAYGLRYKRLHSLFRPAIKELQLGKLFVTS